MFQSLSANWPISPPFGHVSLPQHSITEHLLGAKRGIRGQTPRKINEKSFLTLMTHCLTGRLGEWKLRTVKFFMGFLQEQESYIQLCNEVSVLKTNQQLFLILMCDMRMREMCRRQVYYGFKGICIIKIIAMKMIEKNSLITQRKYGICLFSLHQDALP